MAESEYPSILGTDQFWDEICKTEEFLLYLNPWRRHFGGIFGFIHENLCFQHIYHFQCKNQMT